MLIVVSSITRAKVMKKDNNDIIKIFLRICDKEFDRANIKARLYRRAELRKLRKIQYIPVVSFDGM